jgi:hypothetical protein
MKTDGTMESVVSREGVGKCMSSLICCPFYMECFISSTTTELQWTHYERQPSETKWVQDQCVLEAGGFVLLNTGIPCSCSLSTGL